MSEVQSIAECNLDWLTYDDMYRKDRASHLTPPPWSSLNQHAHNFILRKKSSGSDLSSKSHAETPGSSHSYNSSSSSNSSRSSNYKVGNSTIPFGHCFSYHTPGKMCNKKPCDYKHRCFRCNSSKTHPQFMCNKYSTHHKKSEKQNSSKHKKSA